MKFPFLPLLGLLLLGLGCGKETISTDQKTLEEFIEENNLTVQEGPEGLLYVIEEAGNGTQPVVTDSVTINYVGQFTDGRIFDQTTGTPRTFLLSDLIRGWQLGIPLIGEGGKIKLLLPPSLGYGNRPPPGIPANANLVFDVELLEVITN